MKYKIISAVVATALLSGCNDDADTYASTVQAYDPAVANMDVEFSCEGGTNGNAGVTNGYGNATITNQTFALNSPTCDVTFTARSNAVDMSNGKNMANVVYNIPRGMAIAGQKVTGSPLSTLLAKTLDGADYTEEAASVLLVELGLADLVNNGLTSISEIFLNTEAAIAALPQAEQSKLLATTAVVSDTVKNADPTATADELTAAAEAITSATLEQYPLYPSSSKTNPDADPIYLEIPKDLVDDAVAGDPISVDDLPVPEDAIPVPIDETPTGGTGGSGDDGTGA